MLSNRIPLYRTAIDAAPLLEPLLKKLPEHHDFTGQRIFRCLTYIAADIAEASFDDLVDDRLTLYRAARRSITEARTLIAILEAVKLAARDDTLPLIRVLDVLREGIEAGIAACRAHAELPPILRHTLDGTG